MGKGIYMGSLEKSAGDTWLNRASGRTTLGMAFGAGILVFCMIGGADWLMYDAGIQPFGIMLASDALAGIVTFAFIYLLMRRWHDRREIVRRELRIIGDTNHHIRNALDLIQLSAQTTQNQQVISQITGAIDRIQWVLRELMGESSALQYYAEGEKKNGEKEKVP
jgi:hypothetical protein